MNDTKTFFKSAEGEAEYIAAYEATMQLWSVDYEDRIVTNRFGKTHLVICGPKEAPPLVMLHCFLTSLSVWAGNIAELSRHHRVYVVDMMGQPSKSRPHEPIRTRADMAEWLTDIFDSLNLSKADLMGYSYGGFAALNFAILKPDRVNRLVLIAPGGGIVSLRTAFFLHALPIRFFPSEKTVAGFFRWMGYKSELQSAKSRTLTKRVGKQVALGLKYFRMRTIVHPLKLKDHELEGLRVPVLLLMGEQEVLFNPQLASARAKALVADIRVELIPEAAHDLPLIMPEVVNEKVLGFLAAVEAPVYRMKNYLKQPPGLQR